MTENIYEIIDRCMETGDHPRIMSMDGLVRQGGHQYKLLVTLSGAIDEDAFVIPMKHGLYIDGIFDLGIKLKKYGGASCTLYRFADSVPDRLSVARFKGMPEEVAESSAECSGDCRKHLDALSCAFVSNEVTDCFDAPSPYGECIPVNGHFIDSGFEAPESLSVVTDRTYRTSTLKKKNWNFNKPVERPSEQKPERVARRKGGSRRGEVWWVKNLEYGEPGVTDHGFKDRPVIIDMVVRGIAHFYMCTTNNILYYYPKYRLKEPIEDGLSKDPVYVTLQEREIPENELGSLAGYLTEADMDIVFNPPQDDQYWKRQFKPVD